MQRAVSSLYVKYETAEKQIKNRPIHNIKNNKMSRNKLTKEVNDFYKET